MNPKVRDLYKRFMLVGRTYPQGLNYVRDKVKPAFLKNSELAAEFDIKKAVSKGRYWVRELRAIGVLHKYRSMKRRYYDQR